MNRGVAVTGLGIISALGDNLSENFNALLENRVGLSSVNHVDTIHRSSLLVGEIKKSNDELAKLLALPDKNRFSRTGMLGLFAAQQALNNAGITLINQYKTGLVLATSVGAMDATENQYYSYEGTPELRRYITQDGCGDTANMIAEELKLQGFVTTISTACSSSANAIMLGCRLIKSGKLDRVVVGGADALSKFTINGFKTLMILSEKPNKPFDKNREGLNLGEAAAFLILESDAIVKKEGKKVLGRIVGYANANDAFHQTASSDDGYGAYLAMQLALEEAQIPPSQIDYINVHGTATPNNDLSEGRAMIRIFGEQKVPDFSSTKPFTGHTLAAAGAVEAVFSILAIENGVVYANHNFIEPIDEFQLLPQTVIKEKSIHYVMSNSFGFGGNCSTLLISKEI